MATPEDTDAARVDSIASRVGKRSTTTTVQPSSSRPQRKQTQPRRLVTVIVELVAADGTRRTLPNVRLWSDATINQIKRALFGRDCIVDDIHLVWQRQTICSVDDAITPLLARYDVQHWDTIVAHHLPPSTRDTPEPSHLAAL